MYNSYTMLIPHIFSLQITETDSKKKNKSNEKGFKIINQKSFPIYAEEENSGYFSLSHCREKHSETGIC